MATPSTYDPRVAELQQMLNSQGYTDPQGKALAVDGMMGPLTQYALGQRSASTVQGLPNYFGPDMAMPTTQQTVPSVNMSTIPSTPTSGAMASSIRSTPTTIGSMNPQIGQLLSTLQQRASAPLPAAESTPQYAAAKDRLQREGSEASTRAVQNMAARGVLRSSMTESALQRIEQEIVDRLATQIVPQVQQQLFAERQAELGGLRSDLGTALGMAQFDIGQMNAAQQAQLQAQQFDIEQAYRNAQLQQRAQEIAGNLQESEADRELRERLGFANINESSADRALRERLEGQLGRTGVIDTIYNKIATGQPLTTGEQQIWNTMNPQGAGGDDEKEALFVLQQQLSEAARMSKTDRDRERLRAEAVQDINAMKLANLISDSAYQTAMQLIDQYFPVNQAATGSNAPGASTFMPYDFGVRGNPNERE